MESKGGIIMEDRLQELNDEINRILSEYQSIVEKQTPKKVKAVVTTHIDGETWTKILF